MPHHHQEQALRTGQIDVAGLIDPYTALIQQRGGVRTVFKAVDVIGESQFSLVFFRSEFAAKYPEMVTRFVRAYARAIDFIRTNPKEASDIMARAIGISANLEGIHRFTPNAEVRIADAAYWLDQMRRDGELKAGSKLTAGDVVTTRFADQ
jgi:ABC-type nitrate/sulfonate/bicarbonate transport system substrate-binding protein